MEIQRQPNRGLNRFLWQIVRDSILRDGMCVTVKGITNVWEKSSSAVN